jgi:hypothetical protein
VKNPFSYGAAILFAVAVLFVASAFLVPGSSGALLVAALACAVVGGLIWMMANRLGVFVYRGGKVLDKGIRADAKVKAVVDEADVLLNGNPILELELEVAPVNKEPFSTTVRQMVPKQHADQLRKKGTKVPVRIDPSDRTRVIIDFPNL